MIHTFATPEQRNIDEMSPDEQRRLFDRIFDDESSFGMVLDENNKEVAPEVLFGRRKRQRQRRLNGNGAYSEAGAYVTCKWLGEKTGYHEDTIRKLFRKEKSGIDKRTFSGRNRKSYTVLRISKAAAKRMFPELEF